MGNKQQNLNEAKTPFSLNSDKCETNSNPMNMTPIVFDNLGTFSQPEAPSSPNAGSSTRFTQLSRYTGNSITKQAQSVDASLNLNMLSVIMQNNELHNDKNNASVPFEVVKLSIEKHLLTSMKTLDCELLERYDKYSKDPEHFWRINSKGFYCREIDEKRIAILKPGSFYEGEYLQHGHEVLPNDFGKLFSPKGMYVGEFKNGQAHGQGTYTDYKVGNVCKGLWVNAEIRTGQLWNKYYRFDGTFVDGVANGEGVLTYNDGKVNYKGIFSQGLYDDEEGYFESEAYDYSGGFKQGKKEGIGCLIEKERYIKARNKKYRPQEQFEGYFQADYFRGRKRKGEQ